MSIDRQTTTHGKVDSLKRGTDQPQEMWITRCLSGAAEDLIFAGRSLRRHVGFTLVAVLSAAFGIGTCSAVFGVVNFAFFHKLPVEQPGQLLAISGTSKSSTGGGDYLSFPEVTDLKRVPALGIVAAYFPMLAAELTAESRAERTWGTIATSNYFDVARPKFLLGHGFTASSGIQDSLPPEVVISHTLWATRFARDSQIVGKTIKINGFPVTVVGVTDIQFGGTQPAMQSSFWVPFSMIDDFPSLPMSTHSFTDRGSQTVLAVARLRDGYSLPQARIQLNVVAKTLQMDYPEANKDRGLHIEAAGQLDPAIRPLLAVLSSLIMGIALLVLVTSCVNVANLLLARASARQQEIATRLAIGSSRGRLLRLLLAESVALAGMGGVCGILIAYLATAAVGKFRLPVSLPIDLTVTLDVHVMIFCALLSVFTGLGFGLVPAMRAAQTSLVEDRTGKHPCRSVMRRHFNSRNMLIVVQVSVSMVLLICSGLFVRSLISSRTANTGFSNRDVLLVSVDPEAGGHNSTQMRNSLRTLVQRAHELPGIESASLTDSMPLSFGGNHSGFVPEGVNADRSTPVFADIYRVAPGFFNTLGIPLLHGQDFRTKEQSFNSKPYGNSTPAIVNEAFAQRAFPHKRAIGGKLSFDNQQLQVVGVVANSMSRAISSSVSQCVYLPVLDEYQTESGSNLLGMTLLLKTDGDPNSYVEPIRAMLHASFANIATLNFQTLQSHLDDALILPRTAALIVGACGCMGLVLSAIGIFGVVSFNVARRTKEMGVRMALGAGRGQILALVVKSGMVLSSIGCLIGLGIALVLTKAVTGVLYGVSPHDLLTFVLAPAMIVLVTLLACVIPARRAATLNPVETMRDQ